MQKASARKKAWAKKDGNGWHSLIGHSADVAAVMKVLLRETLLSSRLGRLARTDLSETHLDRLVVLAALHDAGKASRGFQKGRSGHLRPIIGLFGHGEGAKYLSPLPLHQMTRWFRSGGHLRRFLTTTWSHHGEPIPEANPSVSAWKPSEDYDPKEELARLSSKAKEWLPDAFPEADVEPFPDEPLLENAFAGALTLADWIGSDERYFPYEHGSDERAWGRALGRAEEALREMGVVHGQPHSGLSGLLGPHEPYEFQSDGTSLDGNVVVAEGPTGSGKTELAIGRFAELRRAGKVEGMYFGVPTRAAAKQLHRRVYEAAEAIFEDPPPVVQAVPGYVKADDKRGIRRGWDVYWDGEKSRRNWAAEQSKRYTAAPIAVGTVDQALLAMLEAPHAHMRMAGLIGSFLVVDEVHSTSPYMAEVLKEVVQVHAAAGGHSLLMSATVQSSTRSSLLGRPTPDFDTAVDTDYPYVVSPDEERSPSVPDHLRKTVQIEVREVEDLESEFRQAVERHANHGRVLGIRNTVGGARSVHEGLSCETLRVQGHPACHHSRYARADRKLLDDALLGVYGKKNQDGSERLATIATQTAEQSLDIDSDVMVTDLVPMPVFLQRLGRLWRHPERKRPPGLETPKCIVIAPDKDLSAYLSDGEAFGPMGIGTVYGDLRVLKATLDVFRDRASITIPEDSRTLVEKATHPDVLDGITSGEQWGAHERHVLGEKESEQTHADLVRLDWPSTPYSKMRFTRGDVRSRLGELPHTVELQATTPFGNDISKLDIPAWMLNEDGKPLNPSPNDATLQSQTEDYFTFDVCGKPFIYTRYGFEENRS